MKILDVDLLQDGLKRNMAMLERLRNETENIERTVSGLVEMDELLKGVGGNTIRDFYAECHLPFLQFFQLFSVSYLQTLQQMESALQSLEPDPAGYIRQEFLEGELEQGLTLIGNLTEALTNEANSIMDSVSDIVALPHLDDSAVQEGVITSKKKRDETVLKLNEFDYSQTVSLNLVEQDIQTMDTWLTDIEGMFQSGLTDVHFQPSKWDVLASRNRLMTDLAASNGNINGIQQASLLDNQLASINRLFMINAKPITFGYGGFIEKPAVFIGTNMSELSCSIEEVKNSKNEKVNQNIFIKSFNSFKEIGKDFVDGLNTRGDKAFDSLPDFINYVTIGASGSISSGIKERNTHKFDSVSDFTNYASFGFSGMLKGAILPEDPFSKEHWLSSFGVVTSTVGVVKGSSLVKNKDSNKATYSVAKETMDDVKNETTRTENTKFTYKNNPLDNPKVSKEVIENPQAVYGYSPKPESSLIKFKVDWTNPKEVAYAKNERIKYHEDIKMQKANLNDEIGRLRSEGLSLEQIAKIKVNQRNEVRINNYLKSGNKNGLESLKKRNLEQYGNPQGPTPNQLYEKYGSWEEVIYASTRSNPGMDVLTGLYDIYGGN